MNGRIDGFHLVGREPSIECDPDLFDPADEDPWNEMLSNTEGALTVTIGENMTITAPKGQRVDGNKRSVREGHVTHTVKYRLNRNSGNDELVIRQGSTS